MASERRERPQRNRRPPKIYGFEQEEDEDAFVEIRLPSPPRLPIDTRPAFDHELARQCAFPSLDPVAHVGPGPSEVYKAYRQAKETPEVEQMDEYFTWYHERIDELNARKRAVGWRDIGPFWGDVPDEIAKEKAAREKAAKNRNYKARSRGISVGPSVHVDPMVEDEDALRVERAKWEKIREQEFVWPASSSGEEEEEEKDKIQQRDLDIRSSRLILSVRNVNHAIQKEAVAEVKRVRSLAQSQASRNGRVNNLSQPPASALANRTDADGDTVMGGGDAAQLARQLLRSLPKPFWELTIRREPKSPRRPIAAEKGKGKEIVPGMASRNQRTLGPAQVSQPANGRIQGASINPRRIQEPTSMILKITSVATVDWPSLPANIQYLITYLLTAVHVPPYSFAQTCTLLSLSSGDIISLLYLINQETRKMIVLDNLSNQLAAIGGAEKVSDALDRLKPQGLVTDSVSSEDIRKGQTFLRYLGLNKVAEWLEGYMGVSSSWCDDNGRYAIKINGKLLDGDIPAETAGSVLRHIWREEQESVSRVENTRRTEAQRASMRPPSPGLVNPSVLKLPIRSAGNGKVLTVQEVEQATRGLTDLDLLVPESEHYTVSLNGQSVLLEEGRQARRLWNEGLQTMRQAQRLRQNAMAPPVRPALRVNQQRQASRPTLEQVAGRNLVGTSNRGGEQRQEARGPSRAQQGAQRDVQSRGCQATLVQRPLPSARAISSAPVPMNLELGTSRTATYDHDQGQQQRQKERPSLSTNKAHQTEPTIAEESKSSNSATNDYLLSIGINLSLHKPPQIDTLQGSPTLEAQTTAFLEANKTTLAAMEKEEIEEEEEKALRLRQASEARTLRSNSVYSSRFPSKAPSVVPATATTNTRPRGTKETRGNPHASAAFAIPSSTHEMARRWQELVSKEEVGKNPRRQESAAPNDTPHRHAPAGSGNSRPAPTAATTTEQAEARPVSVATPPAPQTPASQKKKTTIILKIGGRRVISQSTFTNTPQSEPPVQTSPPTLGRNFTEPTRHHHDVDVSQEQPLLTPRRNLFGTVPQQQHSSYPTLGAPAATSLAHPITPQVHSQAAAGGESQRTMGGRAIEDVGKR